MCVCVFQRGVHATRNTYTTPAIYIYIYLPVPGTVSPAHIKKNPTQFSPVTRPLKPGQYV